MGSKTPEAKPVISIPVLVKSSAPSALVDSKTPKAEPVVSIPVPVESSAPGALESTVGTPETVDAPSTPEAEPVVSTPVLVESSAPGALESTVGIPETIDAPSFPVDTFRAVPVEPDTLGAPDLTANVLEPLRNRQHHIIRRQGMG